MIGGHQGTLIYRYLKTTFNVVDIIVTVAVAFVEKPAGLARVGLPSFTKASSGTEDHCPFPSRASGLRVPTTSPG